MAGTQKTLCPVPDPPRGRGARISNGHERVERGFDGEAQVTTHVVTSLVLRPKGGSPGVRTEFLRRVLTLGAETAWSHHIAPAAL
jgi:hypothetical protein